MLSTGVLRAPGGEFTFIEQQLYNRNYTWFSPSITAILWIMCNYPLLYMKSSGLGGFVTCLSPRSGDSSSGLWTLKPDFFLPCQGPYRPPNLNSWVIARSRNAWEWTQKEVWPSLVLKFLWPLFFQMEAFPLARYFCRLHLTWYVQTNTHVFKSVTWIIELCGLLLRIQPYVILQEG